MRHIAQKDPTLQQKGCVPSLAGSGGSGSSSGVKGSWCTGLLLQQRVVLPNLLATTLLARWDLLTTQDDLLKQEDMILPVNVGFSDGEYIVKEEVTEVFEVVALPVVNAGSKALNGLVIFGPALRFIDFIGYTLGSFRAPLEFFIMRISCRRKSFD